MQRLSWGTDRLARGVAHHRINPSNTGDIEQGTYRASVMPLCNLAGGLGTLDQGFRRPTAVQGLLELKG